SESASPPPLALDRPYRWEFSLGLTPSPAQNPRVDGMIKRISLEPTVVAQLNAATPLQQAAVYANQGIWQDALTILAHQRQLAADASLVAWTELLASVGLGAIAPTPMLHCCPSQAAPHNQLPINTNDAQ
ncbi:MAG: DUF928 domain-containing protein, partial [Leptolyngbyaceae cyanobacterium SL_7_1]|nr:DUF928 domain-containing protein [Leptolyngbyaceae cyanobacterium SL_7_1]